MFSIGRGSRRIAKYEESKSHIFIASIINFTIIYAIYVTILAGINSFIGEEFISFNFFRSRIGLALLGITALINIIYAFGIHEKVGFITWGEKMAGRKFVGIRKNWFNPFNRKRRVLFLVFLLNMYIIANYFGGIPSVYGGIEFLREVLTLIIHVNILISIGQGNINQTILLILLYLVSMIATLLNGVGMSYVIISVFGVLIALHLITLFMYRKKEKEF